MEEGWIKLHRKFLNWEWIDMPEMVKLFIYLLMEANHEEKQWHGQTIARGQLVTSIDKIAEDNHYSVQKIRTCLRRLEKTGEIIKKSTNKFTTITISNYGNYQLREEQIQQTNNKQTTNKQQTNNNKQECKEDIYKTLQDNAGERAREETVSSADWRHVSSVRRALLGNNRDKIAAYKRELFRDEVERLAPQVKMNSRQVDSFVRWWTENTPGSETLKAEYQDTFDILSRMQSWMERERPAAAPAAQPKGRMEKLEDDLKLINDFFYGQHTTNHPDEQ